MICVVKIQQFETCLFSYSLDVFLQERSNVRGIALIAKCLEMPAEREGENGPNTLVVGR